MFLDGSALWGNGSFSNIGSLGKYDLLEVLDVLRKKRKLASFFATFSRNNTFYEILQRIHIFLHDQARFLMNF